jgi:hypothetical protein
MMLASNKPVVYSWWDKIRFKLITWLANGSSVMVNYGVDIRTRTIYSTHLTYIGDCMFIDFPDNKRPLIICDQEKYNAFRSRF